MAVKQIFGIVNAVTQQAMGQTALAVIDNQSLIALGNSVLSSASNVENWTGVLVERIGRTIISERRYNARYKKLLRDDFEWGNILQKITIDLPDAEKDDSYDIEDGGTVDHYKVKKPKIKQSFFTTSTPWQMHISIKREQLEEAFTSTTAMSAFISSIFTAVQNKIELSLERLSMNCVNNYIAEVNGGAREIKLLTMYNALTKGSLTAENAMQDDAFLRFCVKQIKLISDRMTVMTKGVYNDGTVSRHTPMANQVMYISSEYERSLETVTQYQAFKDGYVKLQNYETIPFWQSIKTPEAVQVNRASDGTMKKIPNVLGVLFDIEALGTYKKKLWTATTPLNAAGGYTNFYWHLKDMYFNDLSENFVAFVVA